MTATQRALLLKLRDGHVLHAPRGKQTRFQLRAPGIAGAVEAEYLPGAIDYMKRAGMLDSLYRPTPGAIQAAERREPARKASGNR